MAKLVWSIRDLTDVALARQQNKFDVNIAISGARGSGKSTFGTKLLYRLKNFNPWKQQVYKRSDVMKLLEEQKFGKIFDDEGINSGYKRDFQNSDQKELIKMLNMYRDNFNVYVTAIPKFYSLDKDLRDLYKIHIHVTRRGFGVVHVANHGNLYSEDVWDVKYNKKLEESWAEKRKKNPNFSPPYHKLTTFRGYIVFADITPKQRELYEKIKVTKRREVWLEKQNEKVGNEAEDKKKTVDIIKERLLMGKIKSTEEIQTLALVKGEKYSNILWVINKQLRDEGKGMTVTKLVKRNNGEPEERSDSGVKAIPFSNNVSVSKNPIDPLLLKENFISIEKKGDVDKKDGS